MSGLTLPFLLHPFVKDYRYPRRYSRGYLSVGPFFSFQGSVFCALYSESAQASLIERTRVKE
jgi:hypothetical protein